MCGDEVKIRIKLLNNQIENISAIVRGCALCEASAGLTVKILKKNELPKSDFIAEFLYEMEAQKKKGPAHGSNQDD